ncbi:MAG: VWA domain-containing protein, partial [Calditrichaeota bacterium]|nr:VWA domain-containing protein [Calditrichota bacterium]
MKKSLYVFIILFLFSGLHARDKKELDLQPFSLAKSSSATNSITSPMLQTGNDLLEITLLHEGYFTVGTKNGMSASDLDDNCPLTFGHPYAMTSYPLFAIDGEWYRFETFFENNQRLISQFSNGLQIIGANEKLQVTFTMTIQESTLQFSLKSQNLDSTEHTVAAGLVFDSGIANNGDGHILENSSFIKAPSTLNSVSSVAVWERANNVKGAGFSFDFQQEQPNLIIANWPQIYETDAPQQGVSPVNGLYDQALKFYWLETALQSAAENQTDFSLSLSEPDFSGPFFMRWDLPAFFSMADNTMFPRDYPSYMNISRNPETLTSQCTLTFESDDFLSTQNNSYLVDVPADHPLFQLVNMRSEIVYEDNMATITARLADDGNILDELTRTVYFPATPVSEDGLTVTIDSLILNRLPNVGFTFDVSNTETERRITNLKKENIFLYENDERISDFSFGKDTTGGAGEADIVFVLDVTGSMGNEINDVKNNIIEFTDSLSGRNVDYRLGMVTFLDVIENVYPFTSDAQYFQQKVAEQYAHGGGDGPENSLDALYRASEFPFRATANRIIVWITDANYHEADAVTQRTKTQIIDALLANGIIVHNIGNEGFKSTYYDPILLATGGNYYNIYGNFRDILLDISRLNRISNYLINFQTAHPDNQQNHVKVEIRYAGLGGYDEFTYDLFAAAALSDAQFSFFPNPFNPTVNFRFNPDFKKGDLVIYNSLGQTVKHFDLQPGASSLSWNAQGSNAAKISS